MSREDTVQDMDAVAEQEERRVGRTPAIPEEIWSSIAKHLERDDLTSLHSVDKNIRDKTDYIYGKLMFTTFEIRTTDCGLARFLRLVHSRFTERVETLEIFIRLRGEMDDSPQIWSRRGIAIQLLDKAFRTLIKLKGVIIHSSTLGEISEVRLEQNLLQTLATARNTQITFIATLFIAMRTSKLKLREFEMENFPQELKGVHFAPTLNDLTALYANLSPFKALTTLSIECAIEFSHINDPEHPDLSFFNAISAMSQLKRLRFVCVPRFTSSGIQWVSHALLRTIGVSPPFSLSCIELENVEAHRSITLDKVVTTHANTLQRLSFNDVYAAEPNTMYEFFSALANTKLVYFGARNLHIQEAYIVGGEHRDLIENDGLDWQNIGPSGAPSDQSYKDWVNVIWRHSSPGQWLEYDSSKGIDVKKRVHECLRMLEFGAL